MEYAPGFRIPEADGKALAGKTKATEDTQNAKPAKASNKMIVRVGMGIAAIVIGGLVGKVLGGGASRAADPAPKTPMTTAAVETVREKETAATQKLFVTTGDYEVIAADRVLVGDSIGCNMKDGSSIYDGESRSLVWSTDDESIAKFTAQGVLTAVSAGETVIHVEADGKFGEKKIDVVEVDTSYGAEIRMADEVDLTSSESQEVTVECLGKLPEHYDLMAYYCDGAYVSCSWGGWKGDSNSLILENSFVADNGDITIYLYDGDDPGHVVASHKLSIKVK